MALFVGTLALYLFTLQPGLTWGTAFACSAR